MNRDCNSFAGAFMLFVWWVVAGMGLHVGWGLIGILAELLARAVGRQ